MAQYNPRIDMIFKKIFGVDENKDLLISLINSIVSEEDQIRSVTLKNPYNQQNFLEDKASVLDVKAEGCNGKLYSIEIQIAHEKSYEKRALYYWGKMYVEQLKAAGRYESLQKAIGIHLLNFNCLPEEIGHKKYHNVFHIREEESGIQFFRDLELHTIELDRFIGNLAVPLRDGSVDERLLFVQKIQKTLDWWAGFLTRNDLMQRVEDVTPEVKKALDVLEYMYLSEKERQSYDDREKFMLIINDAMEKLYDDGLAEGHAAGHAEGLQEGREAGKQEERRLIAMKMLQRDIDDETILEVTGFRKSELMTH